MIRKFLKLVLLSICALLLLLLFLRRKPSSAVKNSEDIRWGVVFSKKFSSEMGLNWQENYLAILDDLNVKIIRIPMYWQDVEPQKDEYIFDDYDWMINEAKERSVGVTFVIGRKVPRWPECHVPEWASDFSEDNQQAEVLELLPIIVERYKDSENLKAWQVENEPFLDFGICPSLDVDFLDSEIDIVRTLDPERSIVVTDSGELSTWVRAAKRADIFGTTMYRTVYTEPLGYVRYPLTPNFFWKKANIVHFFDPGKSMIVSELQAEPWGPQAIYDMDKEEQDKSMSIKQFEEIIEYAEEVSFPEVYFWGVEWWYWLKETQGRGEFWEYAKARISR